MYQRITQNQELRTSRCQHPALCRVHAAQHSWSGMTSLIYTVHKIRPLWPSGNQSTKDMETLWHRRARTATALHPNCQSSCGSSVIPLGDSEPLFPKHAVRPLPLYHSHVLFFTFHSRFLFFKFIYLSRRARTPEPQDHDLSRSRMLNRWSHPAAPGFLNSCSAES